MRRNRERIFVGSFITLSRQRWGKSEEEAKGLIHFGRKLASGKLAGQTHTLPLRKAMRRGTVQMRTADHNGLQSRKRTPQEVTYVEEEYLGSR